MTTGLSDLQSSEFSVQDWRERQGSGTMARHCSVLPRPEATPRAFLTEEAAGALPAPRKDPGISDYRHTNREQVG